MDPAEQLEEARARAKVLVEVVKEQGLAKTFGNAKKPHVFVEGWQFLASQFGLIPEIEWTKELDGAKGWEARAVLRRLEDGQVISAADGECRTSERNWQGRDSYAVRSMAQTRAVSKVCRIALSSVMVMAGFNATPAEEMDGVQDASWGNDSSAKESLTADDPHCPACLDAYGTLVALWANDKKPFWKCKAKEDCAAWDGSFAWSGWRTDFENSVAEWRGGVVKDDPKTAVIGNGDTRIQRSGYIVKEIMETTGLVSRVDAEVLVKPGLVYAIDTGKIDAAAALGAKPGEDISDDELRIVIANLTMSEADAVVAAAASLAPFETDAFEEPDTKGKTE
jgi:hypothetical protein